MSSGSDSMGLARRGGFRALLARLRAVASLADAVEDFPDQLFLRLCTGVGGRQLAHQFPVAQFKLSCACPKRFVLLSSQFRLLTQIFHQLILYRQSLGRGLEFAQLLIHLPPLSSGDSEQRQGVRLFLQRRAQFGLLGGQRFGGGGHFALQVMQLLFVLPGFPVTLLAGRVAEVFKGLACVGVLLFQRSHLGMGGVDLLLGAFELGSELRGQLAMLQAQRSQFGLHPLARGALG